MKNLKILLVEDETDLSALIARMLKWLGHRVVARVTTGETAIKIAPYMLPDLVLTDIFLAGSIDGPTLAYTINISLGIPVIIMGSYSEEQVTEFDPSMTRHEYLRKPFASEELAQAIARICARFSLC